MTKDKKESLVELLNRYIMCSALNDYELGCTTKIEMDIVEKVGSELVYSRPYKASAAQREARREIVGNWKRAGLVMETASAYASPCLLIEKEDVTPRLVVDYRRLNKNTV